MPIIFEKSVFSSVLEKALSALIAMIVGCIFTLPFILVEELPMLVSIFSGGAIIIALVLTVVIIKEAIQIARANTPWRVVISEKSMAWESPVQKQMESFFISLNDIQAVRRNYHRYPNSKRSPDIKFFIEFKNGNRQEIKAQMSGINPMKVFEALEKKGISFFKSNTLADSGKRSNVEFG